MRPTRPVVERALTAYTAGTVPITKMQTPEKCSCDENKIIVKCVEIEKNAIFPAWFTTSVMEQEGRH